MRAKKIPLMILAMTVIHFVVYFFAVDILAVPDRKVAKSYRQFLLETSGDLKNKIIIASGSNAQYGIDASVLEKEMHRYTVNFSDNAAFQLPYRIRVIEQYLEEGDVILLPLEWHYYHDNPETSHFAEWIFGLNGYLSFYYDRLKWYEKVELVFKSIPFRIAIKNVITLNGISSVNQSIREDENRSLHRFAAHVENNDRGSNLEEDFDLVAGEQTSCDGWMLGYHFGKAAQDYPLSDRFLHSLDMLSEIAKQRKVRVIFTWPVAVGYKKNDCYTSDFAKSQLDDIINIVKSEVEGRGFEFFGDHKDTVYDHTCYLDSVYHIKAECAKNHTRKIIAQLRKIGVSPDPDYSGNTFKNILNARLRHLENNMIGSIEPNEVVKSSSLKKYLIFGQGWQNTEKWGVWSQDYVSDIRLKLADTKVSEVHITGTYFNGPEKTKVYINNKFVGAHILSDNTIPLENHLQNNIVSIRLVHTNVISPLEAGISKNPRKIKFGLKSIEFR